MSTDWDLYRKCPVCAATTGNACAKRSGSAKGFALAMLVPHSSRKLRSKAARARGER